MGTADSFPVLWSVETADSFPVLWSVGTADSFPVLCIFCAQLTGLNLNVDFFIPEMKLKRGMVIHHTLLYYFVHLTYFLKVIMIFTF